MDETRLTQLATQAFDLERSMVTVRVGKTGLLQALGHEHMIEAKFSSGTLTEGDQPSVECTLDVYELVMQPDAGINASEQARIQEKMLNEILEADRFPEIVFRSTGISETGPAIWNVTGILSLHGIANQISFEVRSESGAYVGSIQIRQTDFEMKPETVAGGLVKVMDELEIDFEVWPEASRNTDAMLLI
jgi:hypothetical protein